MSIKTVQKALAEQRDEQPGDLKPCAFCATPTLHGTLAMFGARCSACYRDYCKAGNHPRPGEHGAPKT